MNCVDYAITEIINGGDIPSYLLKLAFEKPNNNIFEGWYDLVDNHTVEQGLREKVIHNVVLPRCKIQGGVTQLEDLTGSVIQDLGQGNIMVQVPDWKTGGRKIISVIEVFQGTMASNSGMLGAMGDIGPGCGVGALNEMQQGLQSSLRGNASMPRSYRRIQMLGNNTFIISGAPRGLFTMTARLIYESDDSLSEILPQMYPYFAILCNHAVKAHIYKEHRYPANEAVKRAGVPVSAITDDINSYANAWENYLQYFDDEWLGYMINADAERQALFVKWSVPRKF